MTSKLDVLGGEEKGEEGRGGEERDIPSNISKKISTRDFTRIFTEDFTLDCPGAATRPLSPPLTKKNPIAEHLRPRCCCGSPRQGGEKKRAVAHLCLSSSTNRRVGTRNEPHNQEVRGNIQ